MHRQIKFLAVVVWLFILTACGSAAPEVAQPEVTTESTSATEAGSQEMAANVSSVAEDQAATITENPQSCVESYDPATDYFPHKTEALYAQAWEASYATNYKVVTTYTGVASSHAGTDAEVKSQLYVLVQCGTPAPALEGDLADAKVIEIPIATAVDGDDALFESFEFLGVADGLLGAGSSELTEVEAPYLPTIYARQQSDELVTLGYDPNLEALADLEPDIYIKSSGEEELFQEIEETLGIPVVFFNPYQESPLGAAEKLRFLSLFYNKEQQANEHLEPAIARYLELQTLAEGVATKPRVLIGFAREDGTWSTRQNDRYEMILVRDAGGQRVLDLPGNGFTNVDLEVVVEEGLDTNFWFNLAWLPAQKTLAEFIEVSPVMADFQAVQNGKAFHRFGARGIDYAYNGNIDPDIILADMISLLHPELLPDHEIVYLQPIPLEQ